MIEKALGDIADDSLIVNCGEVDEEPEESGITVEAEVEGDSVEEPSSPTTPAGLEVSHQVLIVGYKFIVQLFLLILFPFKFLFYK